MDNADSTISSHSSLAYRQFSDGEIQEVVERLVHINRSLEKVSHKTLYTGGQYKRYNSLKEVRIFPKKLMQRG